MSENRPQWLREREVSKMTGIALSTLRNWRHRGEGPRFDKPSPRCVRYRQDEIEQFMTGGQQ